MWRPAWTAEWTAESALEPTSLDGLRVDADQCGGCNRPRHGNHCSTILTTVRRVLVVAGVVMVSLLAVGVALADDHEPVETEEPVGMPPFLTGDSEMPPGLAKKESLPPGLAKKLGDNTPPGQAKKNGEWTPPGLANKGSDWLPPGLAKKDKIPPGHAKRLGVEPTPGVPDD